MFSNFPIVLSIQYLLEIAVNSDESSESLLHRGFEMYNDIFVYFAFSQGQSRYQREWNLLILTAILKHVIFYQRILEMVCVL